MRSTFRTVGAALVCSAAFGMAASRPAFATSVEPMSIGETVHDAEAIMVGRAVAMKSRYGDASRRFMLTDYAFKIEDTILESGEVRKGKVVNLTFWGGQIGEERQGIAGLSLPSMNEKLVLMLRENHKQAGFTPVVGLNQGMFRIRVDAGKQLVTDAEGLPLAAGAEGAVVRTSEEQAEKGTKPVTLESFMSYLRANLAGMKAMQPAARSQADPADPRVLKPIELRPEPGGAAQAAGAMSAPAAPGGPASFETHGGEVPPAPSAPMKLEKPAPMGALAARAQASVKSSGDLHAHYATFGYCNLPIVINQLPASFSPWSPEDQYQMSKWNYYGNVFRVFTTPTGTYGWGNGRFDLAGWPSSASLQSVYGSPWGATTMGVTFYRQSGSLITEADVALNPAYAWTLDDEWVYNGGGAKSFHRTMTHELGHVWGLEHQFNFLSVMNYSPSVFRAYGIPFMDDAEAIRARYPTVAQARTDLGVYLFRSRGYQDWTDATYPSSVVAGNSFIVNDYHVENVGTNSIGTPTLEWYLTKQRNYSDTYYGIGTTTYPTLNRFTYFTTSTVGRWLTVPSWIPGGDYYLNAFIRNDGGAGQGGFPFGNNYGWSRLKIRVYPRLSAVTVSPTSVIGGATSQGRVWLSSAAGPGGLWVSLSGAPVNAIASMPSSVYVPAGLTYSSLFPINTRRVINPLNAIITGTFMGISRSASLRVLAVAPAAPSALTATVLGSSRIRLNWTDNSDNEGSFRIERKIGAAGVYSQVALVGANTVTYLNSLLAPNTLYYFRVRAHNGAGDSAYSNETRGLTPALPGAPSDLRARAISSTQVQLTWIDNATDETAFYLERKIGAGAYVIIRGLGANTTAVVDISAAAATTYTYRIRAYRAGDFSLYSNEASATTP
jgi:hypothetical protein